MLQMPFENLNTCMHMTGPDEQSMNHSGKLAIGDYYWMQEMLLPLLRFVKEDFISAPAIFRNC